MSFDTLAPYYRALELVLAGKVMQQCRTAYLDQTTGVKRALLLGEGPGRYLVELLQVNPIFSEEADNDTPRPNAFL
jgi:hypothetical protein